MKLSFTKGLLLIALCVTIASCTTSRRKPGSSGRVIVVEDGRSIRIGTPRHDNGKHKGWYKNTNNPHHPRTTNPGHTKIKGKEVQGNGNKNKKKPKGKKQ